MIQPGKKLYLISSSLLIRNILAIAFSCWLVSIIMFTASCRKGNDDLLPEIVSYTFFIAGHTSGGQGIDNLGLYPPFMDKFPLINDKKTEMGFLLGDIVNPSSVENWNEVDSVLQYLDCEVYFAVGNHDITNRSLFESRYGKTYYGFTHNRDLFIVLDPNIDHWNISGNQLSFLKKVLGINRRFTKNIFVFFHQLIWWDEENKYAGIYPNSLEGRAGEINFWTEIEPLFNTLPNDVYMFAGDLGATDWSTDIMYDHYDNITFIASGMGDGKGDNFVFVHVDETGSVSFELIALNNPDIHAMGEVEDYIVP